MASPNPAEIRMQQDIQQRQREEQLRQTMQPESDVRLHQKTRGKRLIS
ncbi:hemolysin secretion/activation protein, ShlB family [Neisseria lactamica ATCC 23970]|uniref:Hemolysin secretion/activation protein, ShlB family n=1 Tax=Neisseria lactamica ATCC 23970 TaxID=546265 RepID=D0WDN0_NEILA|nr:hemolysin secretion/activation protein, ShlB family [Neisseria lactamica ATCC 23970]